MYRVIGPNQLPLARRGNRGQTSLERMSTQQFGQYREESGWGGGLDAKTFIIDASRSRNRGQHRCQITRGSPDVPVRTSTLPTFVDLFAGCGELSLGLQRAGWRGLFAVERDPMAFGTFEQNFLAGPRSIRFDWPEWLDRRPWAIDDLLKDHEWELSRLRGRIRLVAGGPPCQGFSFAGRRRPGDPRNMLFTRYAQFVAAVEPDAILMENVPGMRVAHGKSQRRGRFAADSEQESHYDKVLSLLGELGYQALGHVLDASAFGVPQRRPRLIIVGLRNDIARALPSGVERVFSLIERAGDKQLRKLGLRAPVSVRAAISDLETEAEGARLIECDDPFSRRGFKELAYRRPKTKYQDLMHRGLRSGRMDSMRLANHSDEVRERFAEILSKCPQGVRLNDDDRKRLGLLKHRIFPMAPGNPALP
ncbi:MAG: DNA cytosine methyltransferase [Gemmatimonadetes bacterium]|nr:DNA cytosine methyltransferase [Gemmatimonadota bacterium]